MSEAAIGHVVTIAPMRDLQYHDMQLPKRVAGQGTLSAVISECEAQ